ncbi:hypothetical protein KEM52_001226 [Ascosphaera acerosa]|nr:hypothetical protein KEM52_001226 [Ascosphaera acerosa]
MSPFALSGAAAGGAAFAESGGQGAPSQSAFARGPPALHAQHLQQQPQTHQQQRQQQQQAQQAQQHQLAAAALAARSAQDKAALEAKSGAKSRIRDVWRHNLEQEMHTIRCLIDKYPYVSMDTEFPGIVARPMGTFTTKADYHYQTLRCNVDVLNLIQLGITLSAEDGSLPPPYPTDSEGRLIATNGLPVPFTWQFNFRFSLEHDMYSQDSTSMLAKAGIDFAMHDKNGIDPHEFAALLMTSGLVLCDDVHWISFHSGYDFGYMMKILMCQPLPDDEAAFHDLLMIFFPSLYDVKYLIKHAARTQAVNDHQPISQAAAQVLANLGQKSGLQDIADELEVKRTGIAHQAGSDSLVTGEIFWRMKQVVFNGAIDTKKYSGQIWGLNGIINAPYSTPNLNGATIYHPSAGTPQHTPGGNVAAAAAVAAAVAGSAPAPPPPGVMQVQPPPGVAGGAALTPGGGAGVFGGFQFTKQQ